ncbi:hypothetical protein F2Q69_00039361 [Brassica cretica]|uniref:Uncharacterized protein n=1 Tax=Brassica cretica TaxID=69181 RepID=A0A8S9N607_BRACR|nr:hypothetical protein F2Q69_00039361 [Brassica cretica]
MVISWRLLFRKQYYCTNEGEGSGSSLEATAKGCGFSKIRCCYSGVCSNGGGDDLAPAIDLAVAGETRPFSDVSAPGGGDVCGSAFRGRANRESASLCLRVTGLGLSGLVRLS